jgi:hypothetical protein
MLRKIITGAVTILAAAALGLAGGVASAASVPVKRADYAGFTVVPQYGARRVTASWIEPRAIPHGYHDRYSVVAVGLNTGFNLHDISEAFPLVGTEADTIGGTARYYAWYYYSDANQSGRVVIRNSVQAGDHITARIMTTAGVNTFVVLKDARYRRHHSPVSWTRKILVPNGNLAGELPVGASVLASTSVPGDQALADFGTVRFTGVRVNGNVIGSFGTATRWNMALHNHLLATASPLANSGERFSIAWKRGS